MNDDLTNFWMVTCAGEAICVTESVADTIYRETQQAALELQNMALVVRPYWYEFRDLFGEPTRIRLDQVTLISRCSPEGRALEQMQDDKLKAENQPTFE